jgi:hypothetical protein
MKPTVTPPAPLAKEPICQKCDGQMRFALNVTVPGDEHECHPTRRGNLHHQITQGRTRRVGMAGRDGSAAYCCGRWRANDVCPDWRYVGAEPAR